MKKIFKMSVFTALFLISSVAIAGDRNTTMPAGVESPAANFSSTQIEAFVKSYVKVNEIQEEYRNQLDPEMSEDEMQRVATEANDRIEAVINGQENMDTDVYRQILVALETDQQLLNNIQKKLESL